MRETIRPPDLAAQRSAMKKLEFLTGKWCGEARAVRGPGETVEWLQSEDVQYKLGGLVLLIEGVGQKPDGQAVLQALAMVSYDDATASYRMRAFNDGRFLETEVKLLEDGRGMTWGFALGEVRTHSVLRLDEKGEWTEHHEIAVGAEPSKPLLDLTVRKR